MRWQRKFAADQNSNKRCRRASKVQNATHMSDSCCLMSKQLSPCSVKIAIIPCREIPPTGARWNLRAIKMDRLCRSKLIKAEILPDKSSPVKFKNRAWPGTARKKSHKGKHWKLIAAQ